MHWVSAHRLMVPVVFPLLLAQPLCGTAAALSGVQQIAAGAVQTCAIVSGGGVQCWGSGAIAEYYLGLSYDFPSYYSTLPVPVPNVVGATRISAGNSQACAVINSGGYCWPAYNLQYPNSFPVVVPGLESAVSDISAGTQNICAVVNNGAQCQGDNYYGQLGNTSALGSSSTMVPVDGLSSGVSRIAVNDPSGYTDAHACAIANGAVWCWGSNSYGQLGASTTTYTQSASPLALGGLPSGTVTDIALGYLHTCAVVNGAAYCWGANFSGQLGNSAAPQGYPNGYSETPLPVDGLGSGVAAIGAGYDTTCALVNGAVKCWGNDAYGQFGDGNPPSVGSNVPVSVQLALNAGDKAVGIAVGWQHVCAIIESSAHVRTLQCWGDNEEGQLGVPYGGEVHSATPLSVFGLGNVSTISTGSSAEHACAVVSGGAECWGANSLGQLANGSYVDNSLAYFVPGLGAGSGVTQIASGLGLTCAVVNKGAKCWGSQSYGELGNGSRYAGNASPADVSGLGPNTGVTRIASAGLPYVGGGIGYGATCAIVNGGVQCWGANCFGELGVSSNVVPSGTDSNHPYDCYYSNVPVQVFPANSKVTDLAVGRSTACAIVSGVVQCWGQLVGNSDYPNGNPTPVPVMLTGAVVTRVVAGFNHLCAVVDGGVQCWGDDSVDEFDRFHECGFSGSCSSLTPVATDGLPAGSGVSDIAAGNGFTCALANTGVKCWGRSGTPYYGLDLLGTNPTVCFYSNPDGSGSAYCMSTVAGLESDVIAIGAGLDYACALLSDHTVKCWGLDFRGQLGDDRVLLAEIPQVVISGDEIFQNDFGG